MNLETVDTDFRIENIFDPLNHEIKKLEINYLKMKGNEMLLIIKKNHEKRHSLHYK